MQLLAQTFHFQTLKIRSFVHANICKYPQQCEKLYNSIERTTFENVFLRWALQCHLYALKQNEKTFLYTLLWLKYQCERENVPECCTNER